MGFWYHYLTNSDISMIIMKTPLYSDWDNTIKQVTISSLVMNENPLPLVFDGHFSESVMSSHS